MSISLRIGQVTGHVCRPQTLSSRKQRTRYLHTGDRAPNIVPRAIQVDSVTLKANPYRGGAPSNRCEAKDEY
jgi:hypothetical protein